MGIGKSNLPFSHLCWWLA